MRRYEGRVRPGHRDGQIHADVPHPLRQLQHERFDLPPCRDRGHEDAMKSRLRLARDESGAAAVEMAFAVPILIVLTWAFVQLAEVYRAVVSLQKAPCAGARYAILV